MGKASSLSTKRALRQSRKKHTRNKADRTRLKSQLKKARAASSSEQKKLMSETFSAIDRMVKKGIIHKNAAARYKSRLTKTRAAE